MRLREIKLFNSGAIIEIHFKRFRAQFARWIGKDSGITEVIARVNSGVQLAGFQLWLRWD